MEEQLPSSQFVRIHKWYLAAIETITAVRKKSVFIDDMELRIGETYRNIVEKLL